MKKLTRRMFAIVVPIGLGAGLAVAVPTASQANMSPDVLRDWNDFGPCPLGCTSTEVCCYYHPGDDG